ncbi:cytochrome P450 2U1 [Strongylocentrotus purpuratus]|uniref:Cytochrome P450 n=1 Tax=Strongylocentrotus purpuratus TaxID=7668 RepID=A0A7M7NFS4_STRPU|nr:cytochrome P450 2U1 [Strongylocentrotus purpuratus]
MDLTWVFDVRVVLLSVFAVLLTSYLIRRLNEKTRKLPPGPPAWPLLGSIPFIVRMRLNPLDLLSKIPEIFGDIAHLRIVGYDIIILSEYSIIKEAFHRADFSARPKPVYHTVAGRSNFGLMSASGDVSKEQRQVAYSFFRNLGLVKSSFEEKIVVEITHLMDAFRKTEGKAFSPKVMINNAMSNIICAVTFGSRHEYSDPVFNAILNALNSNLQISKSGGLFFFLHTLANVPNTPGHKIRQNVTCISTHMKKFLDDHLKDHQPDQPRDMVDMYIDKIHQHKQNGTVSSYDELNTVFSLADIFAAASETTTTTLRWLMLRMVTHPDIQKKIQDEIDDAVGRDRLPTLLDKPKLPYTEATILEVMRLNFVTPLGVPHQYTGRGELSFHGYDIPEGAIVFANYWSISRDPKLWDDPEVFRPERFLNEEGKCVKPDELTPFSIGKRVCIGESLAKMELSLLFTHLLHRFTFTLPDGVPSYSMKDSLGAVNTPVSYQLCAIPRD